MNHTQARWGLPDWTDASAYPQEATDHVWRWEFLRRRHDYRDAWDRWQDDVIEQGGFLTALTDDLDQTILEFGVAVIHDPRRSFDPWTAWQLFRPPHGFVVRIDPRERDRRFADFRFDIARPLEPQFSKARDHLSRLQADLCSGKLNTPRPSRELWPLYLRLLDAHDCAASWTTIASNLDKTVNSVRSIHRQAEGVRDKFPI